MNRHISTRRLSAYMDDAVPASARAQIEAHLDDCTACRGALADLKRMWEALAADAVPAIPPYFYTRLRARMESELRPRRLGQPGWLVALSVGVALILGFALGTFTGRQLNTPQESSVTTQLAASVTDFPENSLGEVYLTLADIK